MKQVAFKKMHGAGNDFIFFEDFDAQLDVTPQIANSLCDRHKGIGADGIIVIRASKNDECEAYMHYINSDGTLAQMCGNGSRCLAKYLVDNGIVSRSVDSFAIDTKSGSKYVSVERNDDGTMRLATIDMGLPILEPACIPATLPATKHIEGYGAAICEAPIDTTLGAYRATCVSMGNPHTIIFDDQALSAVEILGPEIESSVYFPEKTNVEFAHVDIVDGVTRISLRVWERGCGETLACGTGCAATLVAAHITKRCGRHAFIDVRGGQLEIEWREDGHVFMTGEAVTVYEGTLDWSTIENC